MDFCGFHICVLGVGHLAAAVRVQLRLAGLLAANDAAFASGNAALFLACSDFDNVSLCAALGERVRADRGNVLFACLATSSVRVGPLVANGACGNPAAPDMDRSWDFSLNGKRAAFMPASHALTPVADIAKARVAQIGATVIIRELANILFGADAPRLVDRVTEKNSPSRTGELRGIESPDCFSNETLVANGDGDFGMLRQPLPLRVWHPAVLT